MPKINAGPTSYYETESQERARVVQADARFQKALSRERAHSGPSQVAGTQGPRTMLRDATCVATASSISCG